jgi:L-fucose isomerase-like protein
LCSDVVVAVEGLILACEGDIDGALSMIAHKPLEQKPPSFFDFSQ